MNDEFDEIVEGTGLATEDHWCAWCRQNPRGGYPRDMHVISDCYFSTTDPVIFLDPGDDNTHVHIHSACIVDWDELTLKAWAKRKRKRIAWKLRGLLGLKRGLFR